MKEKASALNNSARVNHRTELVHGIRYHAGVIENATDESADIDGFNEEQRAALHELKVASQKVLDILP